MIPYAETKAVYLGDGETTVFPFSFKYAAAEDVKVALYDIASDATTVLTKDYYVDTVAGTVNYPGYPPGQEMAEAEQPAVVDDKHKIIIYRETELSQPVDLGDKYPLAILEAMHDRAVMLIQELNEIIGRAVKVSAGANFTPDDIIKGINANAKLAADSASAAAASANDSLGFAQQAGNRVDEIAELAKLAESSKNETVGYAAMVMGRAAGVWYADKAYNANDVVVYNDGYIYQCTGYSAPGTLPDESDAWVKIKVAMDDFFTLNDQGYLVPTENPTFSNLLRLKKDGFITIKEE